MKLSRVFISKVGLIFYFLKLFLTIIDRLIPTNTTNANLTNLFGIIVINVSLVLSLLELIVCFIF